MTEGNVWAKTELAIYFIIVLLAIDEYVLSNLLGRHCFIFLYTTLTRSIFLLFPYYVLKILALELIQ